MKKIILAFLLLTPALLAAQSPAGPACTAEAMRFFPKERIELLIGPSSMIGMGTEGCLYQAGGEKMFNGAFLSKAGPEINLAFDAFAQANKGKVVEGNSCDRYATSEGYRSFVITAQKENYLFIIASSIGLADLIDAAEYACAQVAGTASPETTGPFSRNYGTNAEEPSSTPGPASFIGLFIPMIMPILIGLLVLLAIGLIAWSLMHKKKATYQVPTNMMPPPVAPPRPMPPVPPTPQAPVAPPVFTPPAPPVSFTPPPPPVPPTPPAPPTSAMPPTQTPPPSMPQ